MIERDPTLPGNAVLDRIERTLTPLKVSFKGEWTDKDRYEGTATTPRTALFRVAFAGAAESASLSVHPLAAGSIKLVGHWPRVGLTEIGPGPEYRRLPTDAYVARMVEDVESFFRGALVHRGLMARSEFPTDASLKAWIAGFGAREGGPRNAFSVGARLACAYVRNDALELLTSMVKDARSGRPEGEAYAAAASSAEILSAGRMARLSRTFRSESHLGFLLPDDSPRFDEPRAGEEEAAGPTP